VFLGPVLFRCLTDVASSSVSDRKIKRTSQRGHGSRKSLRPTWPLQRGNSPYRPHLISPSLANPFSSWRSVLLDPGGGRNVSDCHFLSSLPDSVKIAPCAQCCDRSRFIGRRRTGKEQKTRENDEKRKVGHEMRLPLEFGRRHGIVFLSQWSGPPWRGGLNLLRDGESSRCAVRSWMSSRGRLPWLEGTLRSSGEFFGDFLEIPEKSRRVDELGSSE